MSLENSHRGIKAGTIRDFFLFCFFVNDILFPSLVSCILAFPVFCFGISRCASYRFLTLSRVWVKEAVISNEAQSNQTTSISSLWESLRVPGEVLLYFLHCVCPQKPPLGLTSPKTSSRYEMGPGGVLTKCLIPITAGCGWREGAASLVWAPPAWLSLSLRLSSATLLRKLILVACTCDLVLSV